MADEIPVSLNLAHPWKGRFLQPMKLFVFQISLYTIRTSVLSEKGT